MTGLDRLFLHLYQAFRPPRAGGIAIVALLAWPGLGLAGAPTEQVVDLSEQVAAQQAGQTVAGKELKTPIRLIRNVTYRVDRIVPTHTNKRGEFVGEADFAVALRYYDSSDFKIKAYSDTGEVIIMADERGEPVIESAGKDKDGNEKWEWRADCISTDPDYSHPKNTCHVGRWKKEHDEDPSGQDTKVARGRYWIKLLVFDKAATDITIKVTYTTLFDDVNTNFQVNGEPYDANALQVMGGKVNKLEFDYRMPDGQLIPHQMYHGTMMHFVIFKPDLSQLAHVHPMYDMKTKKFTLMLNKARPGDMNNKDLGTALPDPGTYYVLTETQPVMPNRQVQAWFSRFQLTAPGKAPEYKALDVEVPNDYPYYDKYFTRDNKEGREGDFLKVRFTKIYHYQCFRWGLQFQLFFSIWDGEKYVPLSTNHFGRWLMMPGHAIFVKENLDERTRTSDWSFRYIAHAHAAAKTVMDGSGLLNYPLHNHGASIPNGNYKIWFQTKILGQVSTFPFTFEVEIPETIDGNFPREDVVQSFCAAPAFDRM